MAKSLIPSKKYIRSGFERGKVPNDLAMKDTGSPVLILVCSVEVDNEHLFADVKGYSANGVTWTIDTRLFNGNTASFNGPWDQLDDFIKNPFFGTDGKEYNIAITLVDSDRNTEWVYAYAMRHGQGVYVCRRRNYIEGGETFKLFQQSTLKEIGLGQAFYINEQKIKNKLYNIPKWEKDKHQPKWYPNFSENLETSYFLNLDAGSPIFTSYCINLAALEIWANDWCCKVLNLKALDWQAFWESAKEGYFYNTDADKNDELKNCKLSKKQSKGDWNAY